MDPLVLSVSSLQNSGKGFFSKRHLVELQKFGIYSLFDLLLIRPKKIIDKRHITSIAFLRRNKGTEAQIEGVIVDVQIITAKRQIHIRLSDGTGSLRIIWFNALYLRNRLKTGSRIRCYGAIQLGSFMAHPSYTIVTQGTPLDQEVEYIYPKIEGVSNKTLATAIKLSLSFLRTQKVPDYIKQPMSAIDALSCFHNDCNQKKQEIARKCLALEECFAYKQAAKLTKKRHKNNYKPRQDIQFVDGFINNLPFSLTQDQKSVFAIIAQDMREDVPMFRLLQGDVGCGKTIVAALASAVMVNEGWQVSVLVPTSVLAQQHFDYFVKFFSNSYDVYLLIAATKEKEKQEIQKKLAKGEPCVVIGTHALLTDNVRFSNLALVITDEQHRFGVLQRSLLADQGDKIPHQLLMTATPIPRTLLMSLRGDIKISNIRQLPQGRKPISTKIIFTEKRAHLMQRLYKFCKEQRQQAYWVCTLINESENISSTPAFDVYEDFCNKYSDLQTAFLHGQLKEKEKLQILKDMQDKKYSLIVATTIIEVGVHLRDAAIVVIENPEHLGLAQLHQLRGRVGRGNQEAYCILLVEKDISTGAIKRLESFANTLDGFIIAEQDFMRRGGGDIFGTKQSGRNIFRVTDLASDLELLHALDKCEPEPEHAHALVNRWFGKDRLAYSQY